MFFDEYKEFTEFLEWAKDAEVNKRFSIIDNLLEVIENEGKN